MPEPRVFGLVKMLNENITCRDDKYPVVFRGMSKERQGWRGAHVQHLPLASGGYSTAKSVTSRQIATVINVHPPVVNRVSFHGLFYHRQTAGEVVVAPALTLNRQQQFQIGRNSPRDDEPPL